MKNTAKVVQLKEISHIVDEFAAVTSQSRFCLQIYPMVPRWREFDFKLGYTYMVQFRAHVCGRSAHEGLRELPSQQRKYPNLSQGYLANSYINWTGLDGTWE